MTQFAAIDFETANHSQDSACAVGVVIVEHGHIITRLHERIRPPSRQFAFTHIHGLTWDDVKYAPSFDAAVTKRVRHELFLTSHSHVPS